MLAEQIKQRISITQIAESLEIALEDRGGEFWALCPFHEEDTPSFHIGTETEVWHCFGCGAGGDSINLVQRVKGLNFSRSLKWIIEKFNLNIKGSSRTHPTDYGTLRHDLKQLERAAVISYYNYSSLMLKQEYEAAVEALDYTAALAVEVDMAELDEWYAAITFWMKHDIITDNGAVLKIGDEVEYEGRRGELVRLNGQKTKWWFMTSLKSKRWEAVPLKNPNKELRLITQFTFKEYYEQKAGRAAAYGERFRRTSAGRRIRQAGIPGWNGDPTTATRRDSE